MPDGLPALDEQQRDDVWDLITVLISKGLSDGDIARLICQPDLPKSKIKAFRTNGTGRSVLANARAILRGMHNIDVADGDTELSDKIERLSETYSVRPEPRRGDALDHFLHDFLGHDAGEAARAVSEISGTYLMYRHQRDRSTVLTTFLSVSDRISPAGTVSFDWFRHDLTPHLMTVSGRVLFQRASYVLLGGSLKDGDPDHGLIMTAFVRPRLQQTEGPIAMPFLTGHETKARNQAIAMSTRTVAVRVDGDLADPTSPETQRRLGEPRSLEDVANEIAQHTGMDAAHAQRLLSNKLVEERDVLQPGILMPTGLGRPA